MEMKHVEAGMEVIHPKIGNCTVSKAAKGWVTVTEPSGTEHRTRAKELEPAPSGGAYRMSEHLAKYRGGYTPTVSYSGSKSHHNGDDLASLLAASPPDVAIAAAERVCDLEPGTLAVKYDHMNPGQKRMNAGNRIRAAMKRGDVNLDQVAKVVAKVQ